MAEEQIPLHHQVVIAAAVAAVCGTGARVRQLRAVNYPFTNAWARQGRLLVQSSHNFGAQRWAMPTRGTKES
jgi:hypothetical protein